MAIARIEAQDNKGFNASTKKLIVPYASTPTAGRLLIATVLWASSAAPTLVGNSKGAWSFAAGTNAGGASPWLGIYYKIAVAEEPKETYAETSGAANSFWLDIYEYSGNLAETPLDVAKTSTANAATKTTGAGVETTKKGDLVLTTFGVATGAVTAISVDSSFGLLSNNESRMVDAEKVEAEKGTYTPEFSWTTSRNWVHVTAAFKNAEEEAAAPTRKRVHVV